MLHPARGGLIVLLGAVLAGCTALFGGDEPQPPCPRVVVVGDAQRLTQFREGLGRDLTDVRFEAEITGLEPVCKYDENGIVKSDVAISMSVVRGPAAESNVSHYEYFVAITNPEGEIIAKRVFPVDVAFPEAILRVGVTEEITQRIAYAPEPDASRHRIFVGFQLTRDQLDYVRSRQ
jgi:hypothetical protein